MYGRPADGGETSAASFSSGGPGAGGGAGGGGVRLGGGAGAFWILVAAVLSILFPAPRVGAAAGGGAATTPATSDCPCRSIGSVSRPFHLFSTSARVPRAAIFPSLTARASGRTSLPARIGPPYQMKSAFWARAGAPREAARPAARVAAARVGRRAMGRRW